MLSCSLFTLTLPSCIGTIDGVEVSGDDEAPDDRPAVDDGDAPLGDVGQELPCWPPDNPYSCKPPAPDRDRPRVFDDATGSYDWPILPGALLYDGLGVSRGAVIDPNGVRVNYGMRKTLVGVTLVYVWAVAIDTGYPASGWVREDALVHADLLRAKMRTLVLPDPGAGLYETSWIVTGGDVGAFGELKVTRGYSGGGRKATDYLVRTGGVVNLVYNIPGRGLGGYSVDSFPVGVTFRRAKGVLQVEIPLYHPGGTTPVSSMRFVYGYIDDGGQHRFGWIAKEALTQAPEPTPEPEPDPGGGGGAPLPPEPAPEAGECAVRCCDGTLALFTAANAAVCRDSYGACTAHDNVLRMRFDGVLIYERDSACYRYCCALCNNRERYHRVEGVTSGCTGAAADYCEVGTRGGLRDADWRDCEP